MALCFYHLCLLVNFWSSGCLSPGCNLYDYPYMWQCILWSMQSHRYKTVQTLFQWCQNSVYSSTLQTTWCPLSSWSTETPKDCKRTSSEQGARLCWNMREYICGTVGQENKQWKSVYQLQWIWQISSKNAYVWLWPDGSHWTTAWKR